MIDPKSLFYELAASHAELFVSAVMRKHGLTKLEVGNLEMMAGAPLKITYDPATRTTIFELVEQPKIKGEEYGKQ